MLNEFAALHNSLASRGIQPRRGHPWIKPFKSGSAVIAELNPAGQIERISALLPEQVASLRNIAPDNQKSFPGFNLSCPVLELQDPALWNQPDALWQSAVAATQESPLAYKKKDLNRVKRLLGDFPLNKVAPRLQSDGPILQSTLAILQRLARAKPEPVTFLHDLCLHVVKSAQEGRLSREAALSIIYGKSNKKWQTTLILDVSDMDSFPYRVADGAVAEEWSRVLFASDSIAQATPFVCALTGQPDSAMGGKMPEPTLKVLGKTYLMSMNKDIPCQTRYGQTSTGIFPVGKRSVQDAYDALLFITDPTRRDKTWGSVPNGSREQGDLLIAYLEGEPDSNIPVAGFFADMETDSALEEATYEARTARILEALRPRQGTGKDSAIQTIALSNIDKGRAQVVFNASYSADAIQTGRDRWLAGTQNIPQIAIPFLEAKGKPAIWRSTYKPSPSEVAISFRRQWMRDNQGELVFKSVPGVDISRVYSLLLDPKADDQASWLLERYLSLTEPLLVGLSRDLARRASLPESARKEALIVVAVYGILLLRQGRQKEIYMNSRDYVLGQFLQMADLLHKLYCKHERKGAIPPQLLGNAAISMALQSPRRALQVLGARMPVYLAWADRFHEGDDVGLVKWSRRELGRLSTILKDEPLDARVSTNGKAELLLGYLASTKQSEQEAN